MDGSEDHAHRELAATPPRLDGYWLVLAGYFAFCIAAMFTGLITISFFLLPIPVAVYCARRRFKHGLGFVGAAALATSLLTGGAFGPAVFFGAIAASGYIMGVGIATGRTYGSIVAVLVFCGLALGSVIPTLDDESWNQWVTEQRARTEDGIESLRANDADELKISQEELQLVFWENWPYMMFGAMVVSLQVLTCFTLSLTNWWIKRTFEHLVPRGKFTVMRPPDWAAWGVIVVVVFWFIDKQSHNSTLQFVSWNGGIALGGMYLLNGVGILLYGLAAWKPHPIIFFGVMFMALQSLYLFVPLGLFDTWAGFRTRIDKLVAARTSQDDSDPNGV